MDRTQVSFAEAEGKPKFPSILSWGEIDKRLRSGLWAPFYFFFEKYVDEEYLEGHFLTDPANSMMIREFTLRRHNFINEYKEYFEKKEFYEKWSTFFKKGDYIEIFDLITFIVRDRDCPDSLIKAISDALEEPYSPYRLSIEAKTIFPAVGPEQSQILKQDLKTAFASPFQGSKAHLQASLEALGNADYRATVREAIHSVESAVRDFTGDTNATLSKAIKRLVSEFGIHKALADAFDKLYAYSSDEKGIRHALVLEDNDKVGLDEAIFLSLIHI